jgi:hypothetical protein
LIIPTFSALYKTKRSFGVFFAQNRNIKRLQEYDGRTEKSRLSFLMQALIQQYLQQFLLREIQKTVSSLANQTMLIPAA